MKDRASDRIECLDSDYSGRQLFDLSSTGVAFLYRSAKKKGDRLDVEINDLRLEAIVVYSVERTDGFRLGLQFQNVTMDIQKKLFELVEQFSKGVPLVCRVLESSRERAKT